MIATCSSVTGKAPCWPPVLFYPRLAPILTSPTFAYAASDICLICLFAIFGLNGLTCSVLLFITSNFGSWYADCKAFCPGSSSYEDRILAAWSKKKFYSTQVGSQPGWWWCLAVYERDATPTTLWACQQPADSFPYDFYHSPFCETCIRERDTTAWSLSNHHVGLLQSYLATIDGYQTENLEACQSAQAANESVCRACRCGDNTIELDSMVPYSSLFVAHAILRPDRRQPTLNSIAALSLRNTAICALILASFRRLHQKGAFLHQSKADAKQNRLPNQWSVPSRQNQSSSSNDSRVNYSWSIAEDYDSY